MSFKDYFSKQAKDYSQFRPTYPRELYEYLASLVQEHHCAWDCATGNGQAAVVLADYFDKVIATDASAAQIEHATPHPKVSYAVAPAENTDIPSQSIDLITIAQALHWFDFDRFYQEVKRVLKPEGIIAAWCYPFMVFDDEAIQASFLDFALHDLEDYWPKERVYCDTGYQTIPFPFEEIKAPTFKIPANWNRDQYLSYLQTWSAVQRYKDQEKQDPLEGLVLPKLLSLWPDSQTRQKLHFDIVLRVGKLIK